jgi:hypothetical protein
MPLTCGNHKKSCDRLEFLWMAHVSPWLYLLHHLCWWSVTAMPTEGPLGMNKQNILYPCLITGRHQAVSFPVSAASPETPSDTLKCRWLSLSNSLLTSDKQMVLHIFQLCSIWSNATCQNNRVFGAYAVDNVLKYKSSEYISFSEDHKLFLHIDDWLKIIIIVL